MADTRITDAEIAGYMGWRGPGAYTEASLRKIREIIDHVLRAERATPPSPSTAHLATSTAPDGHAWLPLEPTEAMVHAAEDLPAPRMFGKVWRAMACAALASRPAEVDDASAKAGGQVGVAQAETRMDAGFQPVVAPVPEVDDEGLPALPEQHEELRARWKCDSCDGRGHDGELHYQGEWQPPEPYPCSDCDGAGQVAIEAYTAEQYRQGQRDAVAADRARHGQARKITELLNNPPYGQPDLYSRLHTALTNEVALAKKFGKLPQWFDAVRGLVDWLERESGVAPSHTTNKENG